MFIPVIRCEEADLYFIVVECIQAAARLPASLGNVLLLLRPGVILMQREAGCAHAFSQVLIGLIMVGALAAMPPEGRFLGSSGELCLRGPTLRLGVFPEVWVDVPPPADSSRLSLLSGGSHWILLIVSND